MNMGGSAIARCVVAVAMLLLGGAPAVALTPAAGASRYQRDAWLGGDVSPVVHAITQTRDGYVWVGMKSGVARFDGARFVEVTSAGGDGSAPTEARSFAEGPDGTLWVASDGAGLWRVGALQARRISTAPDLSWSPFLRSVLFDPHGRLWAASARGLFTVSGDPPQILEATPGARRNLRVLARAPDGALWSGGGAGLARWSPDGWVAQAQGTPAATRMVQALLVERDGTVWAGTAGAGLVRGRGGAWRTFTAADGLAGDHVTAILRDRGGHLWAASLDGGLAYQEGERFRRVADLPCADRLLALFEDDEENLWIGTAGCGLHRLRDRPFVTHTRADGLPSTTVNAVLPAAEGGLWVASSTGGLARLSAAGIDPVALPDPDGERVWEVAPSGLGGIWLVLGRGRVRRWHAGRLHDIEATGPVPRLSPHAVESADGALWLVGADGPVRVSAGAARLVDDGAPGAATRFLAPARLGGVWSATADGVARIDEHAVERFPLAAGERRANVSSLFEQEDGTVWMTTLGAGLRRLSHGRIATVDTRHGLPGARLYHAHPDGLGRLWVSGADTIFAVDLVELAAVAERRRPRVQPVVDWGREDGLVLEPHLGGGPRAASGPGGSLFFATRGGLVEIDPARVQRRAAVRRVVIEEAQVDGRAIDPRSTPTLGPGRGDLHVKYTALSFADAERLRFRVRLEGLDDAWTDAGARREARYTRLPAGRYRFQAVAVDRSGSVISPVASFAFVLRPAFYRTWPFHGACAALAGALAVGWHRSRFVRARAGYRAVMQERARIAREVHDSLSQGFVAAAVQLDCVDDALDAGRTDAARRHIGRIREVIDDCLAEARRSIAALRSQALERGGLIVALAATARDFQGGPVIDVDVKGEPRRLAPTVEEHLFRIAQEAITNAVRHARARRVLVRISFARSAVALAIEDEGEGTPVTAVDVRARHGLVGMRERADALGASLVVSRGATGTRVELEVRA